MPDKSLYQALVDIGAKMDHHESDLYVLCGPEVIQVLNAYPEFARAGVRSFWSSVPGEVPSLWFDIPFQYEPFWAIPGHEHEARPTNVTFYSGPAYQIVIRPNGHGFWEHVILGDEDSGELTFEGLKLVDYDGAFELPQLVTNALRKAGYEVDEEFDTDWGGS